MASRSRKNKRDSQPRVPNYQNIDTGSLRQPSEAERPQYEPMSLNDFENWTRRGYQLQLEYAPQLIEAQRQAQSTLFNNMAGLQQAQAPNYAGVANNLLQQYNPEFRQQYGAQQADINRLRDVTGQELGHGYELGDALGGEIEQGIRGAQMARGNWLGPAPTAQEAFGKGQAAINLYQQRLGNYNQAIGQQQNFLQGRNPTDMMGQMAGSFMGQQYYPNQAYVDTGMGPAAMANAGQQGQAFNSTVMQGYSTFQNALQNYNQNYIGATSANNEAMFGQYDRTADAWQYREAVRNGLYSQPQVGGGGGGMGSGMALGGKLLGGAATGVSAGIGLAAAGVGTGTAVAGGAAAAASAAASALCWLARKLIPDQWRSYRKYLFTQAPAEERLFYIYNARRLANSIP